MGRRQSKKLQTKERILSEAFELFKKHGFKQTSVDMIVQKAQIAKGTFFNYFSTKESLLLEMQNIKMSKGIEFLSSSHIKSLPLISQLRQLLHYLLSYFDVDPLITRQSFLAHQWEESVPSAQEGLIPLITTILKRGQQRGELSQEAALDVLSEACYGLFLSSLSLVQQDTQRDEFVQAICTKISILLQGFSTQKGSKAMRNIVILGGGYGGIRIVQRLLAATLPNDVHITLVDRMPYHCLKTEYYALAAGTEPDSALRVSFPTDPRLMVRYGEITDIDLEHKVVSIKDQEALSYDYLVIGLGCEDRYHGVPGAEENTYSIQTINKTRITYQALNNVSPYGKVAIVGGGLSGVELASELRESRPDLTIQIYDRGESILSPFPERLKKYVRTWFINHGVDLVNKANITKVEPGVLYNHDEPIELDAIVWTAGIQANSIVRNLKNVEHDQLGRVLLSEHHYIPNYPEVFVVGDCASLPHAPSAQLAEVQGDQIALVLQAMVHHEELPNLGKMKLKGVLGSLGKKHGFGLMGETTLLGRVPRVLKTGVLWMYRHHSG